MTTLVPETQQRRPQYQKEEKSGSKIFIQTDALGNDPSNPHSNWFHLHFPKFLTTPINNSLQQFFRVFATFLHPRKDLQLLEAAEQLIYFNWFRISTRLQLRLRLNFEGKMSSF